MAYTAYKADGTPVVIPDNAISQLYYSPTIGGSGGIGVQLLGRNCIDYGTAMAQNLLQMTSNFAGPTMPPDTTSLQGQLWFDTTSTVLYVKTTAATSGGIVNWEPLTGNMPLVGTPLHKVDGTILGYTTNSIPFTSFTDNYEPANLNNNSGFAGWMSLSPIPGTTSSPGMIEPVTDVSGTYTWYLFGV